MNKLQALQTTIQSITDKHDADIYIFSATVMDSTADTFILTLRAHKDRRPNCVLILTTLGGDPDAGYRMVKAIKRYYSKFILLVFGVCKSTGTLIALGADEIVMGDFGEFGPLDIQLTKDDEMLNTSGLSYIQSISSLVEQTFQAFETSFLRIKQRSAGSITTRTSAEVASKLAVGLISPISAQLDPVKLGEVHRAMLIADAYGKRLKNNSELISHLIGGYPSHGFVIDFEEASEVFDNVRFVESDEARLERLLLNQVRNEGALPIIGDMSDEYLPKPEGSEVSEPTDDDDVSGSDSTLETEVTQPAETEIVSDPEESSILPPPELPTNETPSET